MILCVTGGRDFADRDMVAGNLAFMHRHVGIELLIEGGAEGADRLCRQWARQHGIPVRTVEADWQLGRVAGPIRNRTMMAMKPDRLLAFPGGKGTADCCLAADEAGVTVLQATRVFADR